MLRRQPAGRVGQDGLDFGPLTADELDEIHVATLEVLERTGVFVELDVALDTFSDGGCLVDRERRVVKIPPSVVEDCIRAAPSRVTLCGRDPCNDISLDTKRFHFSSFAEAPMVNDLETGHNRPSVKQDVADAARLLDALSEIDVFSLVASATDHPVAPTPHGYEAAVVNTTKHISVPALDARQTQAVIDMAATVVGGHDELRERPIVLMGGAPISPLRLTRDCTEQAMLVARAGLPTLIISCSMAGATGPVTLSGTLVTHNAEVLAGNALLQLTERGTSVVYGSSTAAMDLRIGVDAVGTPEMGLLNACLAQMSRRYGIPSFVAGL